MTDDRQMQITAGDVTLIATLNDSPTANALWNALPVSASAQTWGDEIYFGIPVEAENDEYAEETVEMGAVGYWPPGNALCLFFGPTPMSAPGEIRPASAVNVLGAIEGDATVLKSVSSGATVTLGARMTGTSDELRSVCTDDWRKAHELHPFIVEMGEGTLSLERFQYFMQQDYLFLIDYARVLAIAAAKSPHLEAMGHWASLLDETLNSEMELHRGFCADFGITVQDLEATEPMPATVAYTDHLSRTAYDSDIYELSAALLPCQWGYDEIGRNLARVLKAPEDSFHTKWVAGYNAPEYQELTTWLRSFVDTLGDTATEYQRERMLSAFRASTRYEYLFWDAAWNLQRWPDS